MEALSVFDMLKIGVGPSSSHTLGPWRAVQRWLGELAEEVDLARVERVQVRLYGSLALTGRGHCTDQAIALALLGYDPETVPVEDIPEIVAGLHERRTIELLPGRPIPFDPVSDIIFLKSERLEGHANGMTCLASAGEALFSATYFSIGGGFVMKEGETDVGSSEVRLPFPAQVPSQMLAHCEAHGLRLRDAVWANEQAWRSPEEIRAELRRLWAVMLGSLYRGCHTEGILPGGLSVRRRAAHLNRDLLGPPSYDDAEGWIEALRAHQPEFGETLRWVSAFAMAVNEENANLGRVVTAPTNGAAGVIPAVLLYYLCFVDPEATEEDVFDFLMVAGETGTFFKKGATISAAMGGCQAEIGVSSSMAAAALTEAMGGSPEQAFMAAEIAMEHHLGLTCDPIAGLVQVPCIERNTMGAVKAINAAELALVSDPAAARVTLDEVIVTMLQTAEDMNDRYKETSLGGLAVNVSVRVPEC